MYLKRFAGHGGLHRAAAPRLFFCRQLALLLLMLGILADDHNAALPLDDLAFFANRLDRGSHFHRIVPPSVGLTLTLAAPGDPASGQILGRQLQGNFVTRVDADIIHAHLARYMCQNLVAVGQLHFKHGVGKRFGYHALNLDYI